ncbi:hypothetical protein V8017_20980 [Stenotrophomonas rhizophila]
MKNPYAGSDKATLCQKARERASVLLEETHPGSFVPGQQTPYLTREEKRLRLLDTAQLLECLAARLLGDEAVAGSPRQWFLSGRLTLVEAHQAELDRKSRAARLESLMDATDFILGVGGRAWISERDHSRRSRYDLALESDQGLMVVLAELQGLKKGPSEASTGGAASAPEAGETEGHEAGG